MQQKWIITILVVFVLSLALYNTGKLDTTGYSISSSPIALTVSPAKVAEGANVFFTVMPNGGKYYTSLNIYKKDPLGSKFVANVNLRTEHGSCNICNEKGTAFFSTSGRAPGEYYAQLSQILPVEGTGNAGDKETVTKPVKVYFSIVEKKEWE